MHPRLSKILIGVGILIIVASLVGGYARLWQRSRTEIDFGAYEKCKAEVPLERHLEWVECFQEHAYMSLPERMIDQVGYLLLLGLVVTAAGVVVAVSRRPSDTPSPNGEP